VRVKAGREPTPSAAIIDSQSVKTSQKAHEMRNELGRADEMAS